MFHFLLMIHDMTPEKNVKTSEGSRSLLSLQQVVLHRRDASGYTIRSSWLVSSWLWYAFEML